MNSKESGKVRYAYGVTTALLLGGTAFSIATGPVGAQVAQNAPAALAPRRRAESFADLAARLQPAVVNISTKQRVPVRTQADPFEEFIRRFGNPGTPNGGQQRGQRRLANPARSARDSSSRRTAISSPTTTSFRALTGTGTVDSVTVTLTNRKEYPARIIGRDPTSDLALLKIEGSNLPYVNWGDSARGRGSATGSSRSAIPTALAEP